MANRRFDPGESPFKTKGLTWTGALAFWDEKVPGGSAVVIERLPSALRTFVEQRFLPNLLYDVLPIVPVTQIAAITAGAALPDLVRENARWMALRDLYGVYRFMLNFVSVEAVALRLPGLSMRYFNFGDAEGRVIGERRVCAIRRGIPGPLVRWMAWCTEGFVPVALTAAGASRVVVEQLASEPAALVHGVQTFRVETEIRWE